MKTFKNTATLIALYFYIINTQAQTALTPVNSFGSNPGNLNMYSYIPSGISNSVSLVVALHGCTQTASIYATQSGWNKLADKHKFIMIYPEQLSANNSANCFNWFDSLYQIKNQMEILSIKQMVDYMKSHYTFDTTRIFITGLSAGAGMTTVMLATYPEIFHKGAIMAGLPYKASKDTTSAFNAMGGSVTKTPGQWGALVKNSNPTFTGTYPHVAIFHGTSDGVVNIINATELIKQWTDVNNADQISDSTNNTFQGDTSVSQTIYNDTLNNPVVYCYKIKGMAHGISVDTGACPRQGGATGLYAIKEHFHSTYWAANFFGILKDPYLISGAIQVSQNATNIVYGVTNNSGSVYTWNVPYGATIVSGQGTNSITVNFAMNGGVVSTQEMTIDSCINDLASLNVSVLNYSIHISQTSTVVCYGSATAVLSASVTGANGPYTYKWSPSGGTTSVATGLVADTYTLTVRDKASVIVSTNSFIVSQPPAITSTHSLTICAGRSIIIGSTTHNSTGTFTDVLTSFKGCDSAVTTHLTVLPVNAQSQTFTKCAGESIAVGSTTHNTSGTFTDILTAFKGCDSIVTTHLTILPANVYSQTLTKCFGENAIVGSTTHNTSGTFIDVLTAMQGCDSTVITNLTVTNAIDVSVNISSGINGPELTANQNAGTYQWINCNHKNEIISNATDQSYSPAISGSYAIVIKENSCSDTSFCYNIITTGIVENSSSSIIKIYPNPFESNTTITFTDEQRNTTIRIMDVLGVDIRSINVTGKQIQIERGDMKEGVYVVQIIDENKNVLNRKIVVD